MRNESVAILDIRSFELTFFLGSKGVNDTFVFHGSHTQAYDGYTADGFLGDEENLQKAVETAVTSVCKNFDGVIKEVYVGVPSAFIQVATKGHTISFPAKRKLCNQDVQALYESGLNELLTNKRCVYRSAMYFTLGDNRKYYDVNGLYGVPTTLLQGALCYYLIDESFDRLLTDILTGLGFEKVTFLPLSLAQTRYLLPQKRREGYAVLLDVGFMSSTVSVLYGDGIVHEETIDFGVGAVLVDIAEKLGVTMEIAQEILEVANVSDGLVPEDLLWTRERGDCSVPVNEINAVVKDSLDVLCEGVQTFFQKYYEGKDKTVFAVNPISVTGEGVTAIAGLPERLASRLNHLTEPVYPYLPYYDKPNRSSRISLLNMAIAERKKVGFLQILFRKLGGKN